MTHTTKPALYGPPVLIGTMFSGQLLLDLAESGISREDAYRLVQSHAMHSWKEGLNFREEISKDPSITGRAPAKAIQRAFDLKRQLRNIDAIFARVFGAKKPATQKRRKSPESQ